MKQARLLLHSSLLCILSFCLFVADGAYAQTAQNGVDLVVEADVTIPPLYEGKALPSAGAPLRIVAIPHISSHQGPYTYQWRKDGDVLLGGPVLGQQSLPIGMPLHGSMDISVSVLDQNEQVLAEKTIALEAVDPEVLFYQDNPLRGRGARALPTTVSLFADEATFVAQPYYMNRNLQFDGGIYEWRLNGSIVDVDPGNPEVLTVQRGSSSGQAIAAFSLVNTNNYMQRVEKRFTISFQ